MKHFCLSAHKFLNSASWPIVTHHSFLFVPFTTHTVHSSSSPLENCFLSKLSTGVINNSKTLKGCLFIFFFFLGLSWWKISLKSFYEATEACKELINLPFLSASYQKLTKEVHISTHRKIFMRKLRLFALKALSWNFQHFDPFSTPFELILHLLQST